MGFMLRGEFDSVIEWALDVYDASISSKNADVWYEIFKGFSQDEFKRAFMHHIKTDLYSTFPPPGKITLALNELEEARISAPAEYPSFTTLWLRVVAYFPGKQDYEHFPPETDEQAWRSMFDRLFKVPAIERASVVSKIMEELESVK
jgi:hypothetical protein